MKKISIYLTLILLFAVAIFLLVNSSKKMVVTQSGNLKQLPIEMKSGVFQDSDCGMVINDLSDVSQVISKSGQSWYFHDHGSMAKWLEDKEFKESAKIWVKSRDTKRWINARGAFYSTTDKTAMGSGFGAYEKHDEKYIDFDTMRLNMLRGETLKNPLIKKRLLGT